MKKSVMTLVAALSLVAAAHPIFAKGNDVDLLNKPAPEISAKNWLNSSKPVTLKSLQGKVVVVEFWATWCPPCRKSIPHLIEMQNKYKDKVTFIGITDEAKADVEGFVKENKMNYIIAADSDAGGAYGVHSIPKAFVVGKDGKVIWQGHPMSGLEEAVAKALK